MRFRTPDGLLHINDDHANPRLVYLSSRRPETIQRLWAGAWIGKSSLHRCFWAHLHRGNVWPVMVRLQRHRWLQRCPERA